MLIVMKPDAGPHQIERVCAKVRELGYTPHPIPGGSRVAVCVTGNNAAIDPRAFFTLPGVKELIPVTQPYKLTSRELKPESTVVRVAGVDAHLAGIPRSSHPR